MAERPIVFVVDDQPIIAETLAMILKQAGFRTKAFTSARSAIAGASSESPSLLITDVHMEEMNGIELAIHFKLNMPQCKVLLFSGHMSTGGLLDAARSQGHDFHILAKPVHPKDLLAAIEKL